MRKTIIKFTNHKFVQTDRYHLEPSVYMWDVRTASSFKDPLAVESYNRGALERHRKENELSGLGDEKGPRDYVHSLFYVLACSVIVGIMAQWTDGCWIHADNFHI